MNRKIQTLNLLGLCRPNRELRRRRHGSRQNQQIRIHFWWKFHRFYRNLWKTFPDHVGNIGSDIRERDLETFEKLFQMTFANVTANVANVDALSWRHFVKICKIVVFTSAAFWKWPQQKLPGDYFAKESKLFKNARIWKHSPFLKKMEKNVSKTFKSEQVVNQEWIEINLYWPNNDSKSLYF